MTRYDSIEQRARRGLTLLEIILAVALTVALVGAMFGLYFQATKIRKQVLNHMQAIDDQRLIMDRLDRELSAAMEFPFLQIGLEGQIDSITFTTTVLPGPEIWVDTELTETPPPPASDICLVTYQLQYGENDLGEEVINGLECISQKAITATQIIQPGAEDGEEPLAETDESLEEEDTAVQQVVLLSSEIRFVRFRYFDGSEWTDTWEEGLPVAVEITLGLDELSEDVEPAEYTGRAFKRVVLLSNSAKTSGQVGGVRGGS